MEIVLIIVVLLIVAAVGVALSRRRVEQRDRPALPRRSPLDEQRAVHGDVRTLGPGDVVAYDGTDFIVDRTMHFDEDGFTWQEHLLADPVASRKLWLGVEDDDGLEVTLWERLDGAALEPGPASVEHGGTTYRREEQGSARFRVEPGGEQGTMQFADYSAGDRLLAFERYGTGSWEVSTGQVISEHVLDVYPRGA